MRFYVNELNINLFLPLSILHHDVKSSTLVSAQTINQFIQGNASLHSIIFKQLNEFECNNSTIMKDWVKHLDTYMNNSPYNIVNENVISQELVNLYRDELILREPKMTTIIYSLNQILCLYNRTIFQTGDILEYTTTISHTNTSIPSKIYLHQIFIY